VSSPPSCGGGGGSGTKLCEASVDWTSREDVNLASDLKHEQGGKATCYVHLK
jgi:hypothetical protein